jgi:hypothetical protein
MQKEVCLRRHGAEKMKNSVRNNALAFTLTLVFVPEAGPDSYRDERHSRKLSPKTNHKKKSQPMLTLFLYPRPESNRHSRKNRILNPARLPVPPLGLLSSEEVQKYQNSGIRTIFFLNVIKKSGKNYLVTLKTILLSPTINSTKYKPEFKEERFSNIILFNAG